MKGINKYIEESYAGSSFSGEDAHYGMSNWQRWEKKYKKDYNIIFDDDIQCFLIYTKSKGDKIGMHVGTYNAVDGIFYYEPGEIKELYIK